MKRTIYPSCVGLALIVLLTLALAGCRKNNTNNTSGSTDSQGTPADTSGFTSGQGDDENVIWLKDLKNPFVGTWESQIPSMDNAKMVSEFKTDGTFICGFPDVQGFEGPFNGGYFVTSDIMVSWLDFEGTAAYKFSAIDADTINVTEFDDLVEGNISAFTRVTN